MADDRYVVAGSEEMPTNQRLGSVQALRALAALMVVVHHSTLWLSIWGLPVSRSGSLSVAVDVFFVVSGYVMAMLVEQGRGLGAVEFMGRRLARIAPPYWIFTVVAVAFATLGGVAPRHVAASFLFLPTVGVDGVADKPSLTVGWTLVYEVGFYVLLAVSLWLPRGWKPSARIGTVSVALAAVWLADKVTGGTNPYLHWYAHPMVFEFVVGGFLWFGLRHVPVAAAKVLAPAAVIGSFALVAALFPFGEQHGSIGWSVAAVELFVGFALTERLIDWSRFRLVEELGDASYAVYLLHWFVLGFAAMVLPKVPSWWAGGGFVVAAIVVSGTMAVWFHRRIERPLTKWLNGKLDEVMA